MVKRKDVLTVKAAKKEYDDILASFKDFRNYKKWQGKEKAQLKGFVQNRKDIVALIKKIRREIIWEARNRPDPEKETKKQQRLEQISIDAHHLRHKIRKNIRRIHRRAGVGTLEGAK